MLYLMQEEGFVQFPWCQRTLRGLWDEVRRKRISLTVIDRIEQIPQEDRQAGVLLLGASGEWIERQADRAMAQGAHPILLTNRMQEPQHGSYSAVMMDIGDSMRLAVRYLQKLGCRHLALYGCNPYASSDPWREKVFLALTGQDGAVFHNRNSLRSAFDQFWPRRESFDGVICASDYAAFSLVRHLREQDPRRLEQLAIIGYGNMLLAQRSDPSITSISDDYEHFGKAALSIYQLVAKEPTMSAVRILLHSRLHVRKTTGFVPFDPGSAETEQEIPPAAENPFFADREVQDLARVETLLQQMDEVDLELLRRLMEGRTNAEIAQLCYLSETALKYRLRKMEKVCGVCGREALAAFLDGFFEKE